MRRRCFGLILFWLLSSALALGARVAVVDLTQSPDRAALLTTALAKIDGLEVLERAQMDKLVTEQQLQELTGGGKFSALGKLLGADGLVIIDNIPLGPSPPQTTVRLISVATGACVMIRDLPATATTDADAATWIAHSVGESTAALTQKTEGLAPIAIISIRSELTTKSSGDLDRALKLLLEKQLGNTPGLLLLERRRLGDVAFDKSLDASDAQPLLKGAILVEGTLTSPDAAGQFTGRVRLSRADGSLAKQVEFTGATNALPAAVAQLTSQITDAVGLSKTTNTPMSLTEGHRFFLEARLAWRAADRESAEEALSAARVLGDSGPDIPWLTLALEVAKLNDETAGLDWPFLLAGRQVRRPYVIDTKNWPELRATADETLTDLSEYRQAVLADDHALTIKFDLNNKNKNWENEYYSLSQDILTRLCFFLWQRDEQDDPTVEPLRRQIRQLAEEVKRPEQSPLPFDWLTDTPLEDAIVGLPIAAWALPVPIYADNSEELLSWYEKIFRWNRPSIWQTYIARDDAQALGPRFSQQPAVVEAWHALLQRLAEDPATSLRVRLYQTGNLETPDEQAAYLEILDEIGQQAVELQENKNLPVLLAWNSVRLPLQAASLPTPEAARRADQMIRRLPWDNLARGRLQLVTTLFRTLPDFEEHIFKLDAGKALRSIPNDLVQPMQEAFLAYRKRCLAEPLDQTQLTHRKTVFANWQAHLSRTNPNFDFSSILGDEEGLAVDRFWQPDALVDYPFQLVIGNNDTVWLSGREGANNVIYQLALPALQMARKEVTYGAYQIALTSSGMIWGVRSDVDSPNSVFKVQGLTWIGSGIGRKYLMGTPQTDLTRWDTTNGGGRVWEVPRQYNVFTVADRVFLTFAYPHVSWVTAQDALFEVNANDGGLHLLASTERRPAENPLDGYNFQTIAMGEGPGHTPFIAYNDDENSSKIRQLGGSWTLWLQNPFIFTNSIQTGNQTLLISKGNNLVLLDPELDSPKMLLMHQPNGAVEMANGWSWPQDWKGNYFAYRSGELFSLTQDDLRWWYPGGPAEGVLIHLKLAPHSEPEPAEFPVSTDRNIGKYTIENSKVKFDPPLIGNDSVLSGAPKGDDIIATPSGLIVTDHNTGLWFIPNKDLDAYREPSHADTADDASTEPNP